MYVRIGPYPNSGLEERDIEVRIDDYDIWNADVTLANVILPVLQKLRDDDTGSPMVDADDAPEIKDVHDAWNYVLDEMIWAFTQIVEGVDSIDFDLRTDQNLHEYRMKTGLYLFGKYYRTLWT